MSKTKSNLLLPAFLIIGLFLGGVALLTTQKSAQPPEISIQGTTPPVANASQTNNLKQAIQGLLTENVAIQNYITQLNNYICPPDNPEACQDLIVPIPLPTNYPTYTLYQLLNLNSIDLSALNQINFNVVALLQILQKTLYVEEEFLAARYQPEPTAAIYQQAITAINQKINDLNTNKQNVRTPKDFNKYITAFQSALQSEHSIAEALRAGVNRIANYHQLKFLEVSDMAGKDLADILTVYDRYQGTNSSNVQALISAQPTPRNAPDNYKIALPDGISINVSPQGPKPPDAGLIQLIGLTNPKIPAANELWVAASQTPQNDTTNAQTAQIELQRYIGRIIEKESAIVHAVCTTYSNPDRAEQCNTATYKTLQALKGVDSLDDLKALRGIFCQNTAYPEQCAALPKTISDAIKTGMADGQFSVAEFLQYLAQNILTPEQLAELQQRINTSKQLKSDFEAWMAIALVDETVNQEELVDLLVILLNLYEASDISQDIPGIFCKEETPEAQAACRDRIIGLLLLLANPDTTQEEIINYILTSYDTDDNGTLDPDEINQGAEGMFESIKTVLKATEYVKEMLENREGNSAGVQKITANLNSLNTYFIQMQDAYAIMISTDPNVTYRQRAEAFATFTTASLNLAELLSDTYIKDLHAAIEKTIAPGTNKYLIHSNILGLDTKALATIKENSTITALAQELATKSLDPGIPLLQEASAAWDRVFNGNRETYQQAMDTQSQLTTLLVELTNLKIQIFQALGQQGQQTQPIQQ